MDTRGTVVSRGWWVWTLAGVMAAAGGAGAVPPVADQGILPGDLVVAPANSGQTAPSVARGTLAGGGDVYLAAWTDQRARAVGGNSVQSDLDIFAVRLDAGGNALDAVPFPITVAPGVQQNPKVSWNGQTWLVTFVSQDPTATYFQNNVRAVRVSPDGRVLDDTPILVAEDQQFSWVGGTSGVWLITWARYHAGTGYGTELVGRRLGDNGQFLDATPFMVRDWTYISSSNKVLVSGNEFLAVGVDWNSSTFKAQRVSLTGALLGAEISLPGSAIGAGPGGYYVTWVRNFTDLVGSRVSPTGALLDPAGVLLTTLNPTSTVDIDHDGTNWWVEWSVANLVRAARVNGSGAVLDPGGVPVPVGAGTSGAIYDVHLEPRTGGGVRLFWSDFRSAFGGDSNVFMIPISASNVPGAERVISNSTPNQREPDLAPGPEGAVAVAYVSEHSNDERVLVTLTSPGGSAGAPIEAWRGPNLGRAAIAFNGSIYLIVWDEGAPGLSVAGVKARRMTPAGVFIDPTPIVLSTVGFSPDVGALGDDFLVGWTRFGINPQFIYAQAARMDGPTGTVLDPTPLTLGGLYVSGGLRIRDGGGRWLVTYHSHWSHDDTRSDAIYHFVNPNGSFTPALNPSTTSGGAGHPDAAFSGDRFLFVWRSNSLSNANNYISGRVMDASGSFITGDFVVSEAPGRQLKPVAGWDGDTFVVAWDDQRHQQYFFDARTDIYGARVSRDGVVLDPAAFPVVRGPNGDASAAILSRPGLSVVASARFTNTPMISGYRVGLSVIGAPCIADWNADGVVDFNDFLGFLNDYNAGAPRADLNGDGAVDFNDLLEFLNAYNAPCA